MNCRIIAKGGISLLVRRFAGPFWVRRKWLDKTQWLCESELKKIQLELLKKLIHHCYKTVPYYRQLMDERGINANGVEALKDIKQFPVSTKKDVLQAGRLIVSTKYPKWLMRTARTGGSTGTTLKLCRNLFSIGDEQAFVRRQWDWAGIRFSDRCAWIAAGRTIAGTNQVKCPLYAYDPFMKELSLSAYHLSIDTAKTYITAMIRHKVRAIVGISSAVSFLAKMCIDLGINVKLKAALTTSETLNDNMRSTITKAFGCKIFDFYGSAERVCYIHTCEHGNYHIIPEYGLVELIPQHNLGKGFYKIIATGFWNYAMPLIRYDTGDIVIKSGNKNCTCGRAFRVIQSIIGRESDVIKTLTGREYSPTIISRIVKCVDNILAVQVIQESLGQLNVLYIPNDKFSEKDAYNLEKSFALYLPKDLRIDLKPVQTIPKTPSGKKRLIVSKL